MKIHLTSTNDHIVPLLSLGFVGSSGGTSEPIHETKTVVVWLKCCGIHVSMVWNDQRE